MYGNAFGRHHLGMKHARKANPYCSVELDDTGVEKVKEP